MEICAKANPPRYSAVAKLCKELGADGLDIGPDDTVLFGGEALDGLVGNKGPTFNMRNILEAEDVEATYNKIMASNQGTERNLLVDYGWCSAAAGFLGGISPGSSNYCNVSQICDSSMGCGDSLSSCCITYTTSVSKAPVVVLLVGVTRSTVADRAATRSSLPVIET